MRKAVTTYYLEMTDPRELRGGSKGTADLEVLQAQVPCPELNRFFYASIGGNWYWIDKLPWTYEQWRAYVSRPELETWIGYHRGTPAGYFELEALPQTGVEIAYFGLLPQFVGRGLGAALLTATIERAWALKPQRVWVHTCTLDHPSALANYKARGFRVYQEETEEKELPERTPGPWPSADKK